MTVIINGTNTPTAGGVTYGDGAAYATTPAGTAGQVLTSAGASAPTWSTPSAGAMTLITTTTASSSASVAFTGLTSTYKNYMVIAEHIVPSVNWRILYIRTSTNNGSSYSSGGTDYYSASSVIGGSTASGDTSGIYIATNVWDGTTTNGGVSFTVNIPNPTNATVTQLYGSGFVNDYGQGVGPLIFGGYRNSGTGGVNAIQFIFSSGNIASGTFKLYGIS